MTIRPAFNTLWHNYHSSHIIKRPELFKEIGWDDLINNAAYENTCAIRISLALIKCGITIPDGRMQIKKGVYKGKRIEPGQAKLSLVLARASMLATPEKFKAREHENGIGNRTGIVSFFHLMPGIYENGHIDLVAPHDGGPRKCASDCWWSSKEVWFWPLK